MKKAYGNVPMEWGSVQLMPFFFRKYTKRIEMSPSVQSYPFGTFLGLAFKMIYTLKTQNIKVAEGLKKGVESPIGSSGF